MRRRRRTKATWLPVNPTFFGEESEGQTWFAFDQSFVDDDTIDGETTWRAIPLTLDESPDLSSGQTVNAQNNSLNDWVQGQSYILDRIVGKVWVGLEQSTATPVLDAIHCFAVAVLPCEPGTDTPSIPAREYNPFFSSNIMQPWLIRRLWFTRNALGTAAAELAIYPVSNVGGTFDDSPCIDSSVKRRISKEQRLFAVFGSAAVRTRTGTQIQRVRWAYDLRLLGHMVRGKNRSVF